MRCLFKFSILKAVQMFAGMREEFFDEMGKSWCDGITHVCTDMWRAYLKVIGERIPKATHILDRFHIVKRLNEAVDND